MNYRRSFEFIVIAAALGVQAPRAIAANPLVLQWDGCVKVQAPGGVNGYVETITSPDMANLTVTQNLATGQPNFAAGNNDYLGAITNSGTPTVTVTWGKFNPVPANGLNCSYATASVKRGQNGKVTCTGAWAQNNDPDYVPELSMDIEDDGSVYMLNSNGDSISFSGLQFAFPSDIDPQSEMAFINNPTGLVSIGISSGDVPSGSLSSPGDLYIGNIASYFATNTYVMSYIGNSSFDDDDYSPIGSIQQISGVQIPEPATVGILFAASALLLNRRPAKR